MDIVTHFVAGAGGYRFIKSQDSNDYFKTEQKKAILFYALLFWGVSLLPDIDNIAIFWGIKEYLIHHRGITHSVTFVFLFSLVMACVFYLATKRKKSALLAFLVSFSGLSIHIFMDLITSYGTQVGYPFSQHRYRLDWVFIVDPLYTLPMVLILFFSVMLKRLLRSLAVLFFLWIFIYPLMCGTVKQGAHYWIGHRLSSDNVDILPELGTPLFWKVLKKDNGWYYLGQFKTLEGKVVFKETFDMLNPEGITAVNNLKPFMETYLWFVVYPYQKVYFDENRRKIVEIGDVRFVSSLDFLNKRGGRRPFAIFLVFSEKDEFLTARYGNPLGKSID